MAPPRIRRLVLALGSLLLTAGALAAPASANLFSPETPHSPGADDANTLFWIGAIVATVLFVVINAALLYLVRRYRSERGREPRQLRSAAGIQLRVGAGLGLLTTALFVVGVIYTEKAREAAPAGADGLEASGTLLAQKSLAIPSAGVEPLRIKATGQQWLWRYQYPNQAFSYYRLVVPEDTTVVLDLVSTDVVHSWHVAALSGNFEAVPGKLNHAWFRADEPGVYKGSSGVFSGSAYAAMRTEVDVVSSEDYEAYIDQLAGDIQAAQDALADASAGASS